MQTPANRKILASKIPVRCKEYDYLLLGQKKKHSCNPHGMIHIPASKIPVRSKKHHCEKIQTPSRKIPASKIPVRSKEYNFLLAGQKKKHDEDSKRGRLFLNKPQVSYKGEIINAIIIIRMKILYIIFIEFSYSDFKLPKLIVEQPTTGKPRVTSPTYTLQLPPIGKSSSLVAEQYSAQRKPTYAAAPRIMSRIKSCKKKKHDEDSKRGRLFVNKPQVSYKGEIINAIIIRMKILYIIFIDFSYSDVSASEDDALIKQKVVKLKGQEYGTIRYYNNHV